MDQWITFNESIVPVEFGYFYDAHYPHKVDAEAAVKVAYNPQLASRLAVKACHEILLNSKIGIVLNLIPDYPRSQHPADIKAARIADLVQAQSFLDPSVLGTYPLELVEILLEYGILPDATEEELELIRNNTVDFLGVNYYQPLRVMAPRFAKHPDSPLLQSISTNLMSCQVAKSIHIVVGESTSKGFMISSKTSRKIMAISSGC